MEPRSTYEIDLDRINISSGPRPAEAVGSAYAVLSDASKEAAEAGEMFLTARNRWQQAQAALAEAHERVKRAHEANGV